MKNNWIKFYGENDLSTGLDLSNVETFINDFILNPIINTLNEAIEIYNVLKFLDLGYFKEMSSEKIFECRKSSHRLLNEYFGKGELSEYITEYSDLHFQYQSDFWDIFVRFKVIKRTEYVDFEKIIDEYKIPIHLLLEYQKICEKYKLFFKKKLLSNPVYFEFFLDKYDSPNIKNIYLPDNLSDEEINDWARRYCELDEANINYLERISYWSLHHEYKLDSRIISKARKKKIEQTEKTMSLKNGVSWKMAVGLKEGLKTDFEFVQESSRDLQFLLSKDWIDEEHDYPTILNNFIYFFGFFNHFFQFSMIDSPYEHGGLLEIFQTKSNYAYNQTLISEYQNNFYKLSLLAYFDYLTFLKIDLEEVFAFYYNEHLKSEYGFPDFFFNASSKSYTYYERCKLLIPELDSLLKQFDFVQRYGEIDSDVFELDSKITNYQEIKSLSEKKFVYFDSKEKLNFCKLIFNSQSNLSFPEKKKGRKNFYEYVQYGISINDFYEYQKKVIDSLIKDKVLYINLANQIRFTNPTSISFYYLLWEKGYLSTLYLSESDLKVIEEENVKGNVKYSNTLFSKQESDYISYIMDNKKFSNALAIRNKITHGSYGKKQDSDYKSYYLELLMILIIFTVRINEELDCYKSN